MKIIELIPQSNWSLLVTDDKGRTGNFDVKPFLNLEVFEPLKDISEFLKINNRGYFVEWECGADLSADTIEYRMAIINTK